MFSHPCPVLTAAPGVLVQSQAVDLINKLVIRVRMAAGIGIQEVGIGGQ